MKLLLVDDNTEITDMLRKFLNLKGYTCVVSNDGKNAISLLESERFDLVILDIAMPNFCGFDVLEELDKNKIKQNIFVLTAVALTDEDAALLKQYGVKQIMRKPVDLTFLLHSIQHEIHA